MSVKLLSRKIVEKEKFDSNLATEAFMKLVIKCQSSKVVWTCWNEESELSSTDRKEVISTLIVNR